MYLVGFTVEIEVGSFLPCLGSDVSSMPDLYMIRYPQHHFRMGV